MLVPLPVVPGIVVYLLSSPHGTLHQVLLAPGMVAFPCVFGRVMHPFGFFVVAGLFWYLAAALLLHGLISRRTKTSRALMWTFIVFAALVGLMMWSMRNWNPD